MFGKRSDLGKIMQAYDERSKETERHCSEMLKIYKEEVNDLREQVRKLRKEVQDLQEGIIKTGTITLHYEVES